MQTGFRQSRWLYNFKIALYRITYALGEGSSVHLKINFLNTVKMVSAFPSDRYSL